MNAMNEKAAQEALKAKLKGVLADKQATWLSLEEVTAIAEACFTSAYAKKLAKFLTQRAQALDIDLSVLRYRLRGGYGVSLKISVYSDRPENQAQYCLPVTAKGWTLPAGSEEPKTVNKTTVMTTPTTPSDKLDKAALKALLKPRVGTTIAVGDFIDLAIRAFGNKYGNRLGAWFKQELTKLDSDINTGVVRFTGGWGTGIKLRLFADGELKAQSAYSLQLLGGGWLVPRMDPEGAAPKANDGGLEQRRHTVSAANWTACFASLFGQKQSLASFGEAINNLAVDEVTVAWCSDIAELVTLAKNELGLTYGKDDEMAVMLAQAAPSLFTLSLYNAGTSCSVSVEFFLKGNDITINRTTASPEFRNVREDLARGAGDMVGSTVLDVASRVYPINLLPVFISELAISEARALDIMTAVQKMLKEKTVLSTECFRVQGTGYNRAAMQVGNPSANMWRAVGSFGIVNGKFTNFELAHDRIGGTRMDPGFGAVMPQPSFSPSNMFRATQSVPDHSMSFGKDSAKPAPDTRTSINVTFVTASVLFNIMQSAMPPIDGWKLGLTNDFVKAMLGNNPSMMFNLSINGTVDIEAVCGASAMNQSQGKLSLNR